MDQSPKSETKTSTISSLIVAKVSLRPDIPSAMEVVCYQMDVLTMGNVCDKVAIDFSSSSRVKMGPVSCRGDKACARWSG